MKKPLHITVTCHMCNKQYVVTVEENDNDDWIAGKFAQHAFPYLTPDQRELLISKTCGPCFDNLFRDEEEEVPSAQDA